MDTHASITNSGFSAATGAEENPQAKIEMVFRFWGPSGKGASDSAPVQHPGVLALIEDAVAARRGVFVAAKEQIYVSGLKQPADALVVSRQVQLGLEGFRGKDAAGPVAVSIAIDSAAVAGAKAASAAGGNQGVEPPHDLVTLLKLAKPAQVLLTHDLCQQIEKIKGLPIKSFPGRFGVFEYLWTAEDKLDLLQSEPQLTLAALPVAAPAVSEKSVAPPVSKPPVHAAEHEPAHTEMVAPKRPAFQALRIPILGSLGAIAAVVVFAVVHLSHGPSTASLPSSPPGASPPPVQTMTAPTDTPSSATPVTPSVPEKPAEKPHTSQAQQKQPAKTALHDAEAKPAASTAPATPAVSCMLGGNLAQYVGLAERHRGNGEYADAIRIFREVLDCDPGNAAAREGLEKAQRGAQSH